MWRSSRCGAGLLLLLPVVAAGCQTIHVIVPFPATVIHEERVPRRVAYHADEGRLAGTYEVSTRLPWFGLGRDTFVVEPGRIADEFARAYLVEAFDSFEIAPSPGLDGTAADFLITVDVPSFTLEERRAEFIVVVRVTGRGGGVVFERAVGAAGPYYGETVGWAMAGSFAFTLIGYYFAPIPTPPENTISAQVHRAIYQGLNGEMHDVFRDMVAAIRRSSPAWR